MIKALCLSQLTSYGCVRCEELVEYVRCVCVWIGAAWVERRVSG